MQPAPIRHTAAEHEKILAEGIRLARAGDFQNLVAGFEMAQQVLPEDRRRRPLSTSAKVPWFAAGIKAALSPGKFSPGDVHHSQPSFSPSPPTTRCDDGLLDKVADSKLKTAKIFWTASEKSLLCRQAAHLITNLAAGSARDALIGAQTLVLPPHRRRTIHTMTGVRDWYPDGLQAAMAEITQERRNALRAAPAVDEEATAPTPGSAPATPLSPQAITVKPVAGPLAPSVGPFVTILSQQWTGLRERLVREIADMVAEGIYQGLQRAGLPTPEMPAEPASGDMQGSHRPFVNGAAPAHKQSVLVVGLKGSQLDQIRSAFDAQLDLRFCGSDQSKDQLRSMATAADITIAVTDFISHSHEAIIRARSKRFLRSAGGLTHLKQELTRIAAGQLVNGQAAD